MFLCGGGVGGGGGGVGGGVGGYKHNCDNRKKDYN